MWQKARVTRVEHQGWTALIGREVWVRGRPRAIMAGDPINNSYQGPAQSYECNVVSPLGALFVRADNVELLPEFAEHVAPEPLSEWTELVAH